MDVKRLGERGASEFLGTYLLVFTVGCNVLSGNAIFAAISIAAVLMVMIYNLGDVSGGHFNPAVSLAVTCIGRMEPLMEGGDEKGWLAFLAYTAVQLVAGVLGGLSYYGVFGRSFPLHPKAGFSWAEMAIVEFLYTFLLCFVVLNVACTGGYNGGKQPNQFYGFAIGFVIIAGGYACGWISGGALNPAVALGIDVANFSLWWCWVYMIVQFLAGGAAALMFGFVRPLPAEKETAKEAPEAQTSGDSKELDQVEYMYVKPLSEFIGTYFLVLTVGLNVLQGSNHHAAVFSIAAALIVSIYALGDVSGGHFNPAVTVAILARNAGDGGGTAGFYIGAQLLAGILAGLSFVGITGRSFPLGPGPGFGWASLCVAELIFTFVLCFTVLSVATLKTVHLKDYVGLAIGFTILVGGYAVGAISGACLNPAVAIGIDIAHATRGGMFWQSLAYTVVQCLGGILAACVFFITRPDEFPEIAAMKGEEAKPAAAAPARGAEA
mmetsp:Transcript_26839/g.59317  ORF Transcript_26839/g.59317 Transcript_26839/m.59317 type:complete len:493 (+) Transcript_26839:91-1569(+)